MISTEKRVRERAFGIEYLWNLDRQIVLELAFVKPHRSSPVRTAPGDQLALGLRFQQPINNRMILRFDTMVGWRSDAEDLFGIRFEFRHKF